MSIALTLVPSDQFLRDVLCTAVEGGSNYWADFITTETVQGTYVTEHQRVTVRECGDEDTIVSEKSVGLPELREGVRRVLQGDMTDKADHAQVSPDLRAGLYKALISEDGGDAGQVDANLADCIMQAAALGRIVYG
jgi:hypothetical protein